MKAGQPQPQIVVQWAIRGGPREYEPSTTDASLRWSYDIQHAEGHRRSIAVEVARSLAAVIASGEVLGVADVKRAIQTRGRSAVEGYLCDEEPPERIILSTHGIHAATT